MGPQIKTQKAKRIRISVDVPLDIRRHLKGIANERDMFFKDYLQDVFEREVKRHPRDQTAAN